MRAKLERIAAGQFEYETPKVTLSEQLLNLSGGAGEQIEGSFTIACEQAIKGVVYSSSYRMRLEQTSFHARNVRMNYCFDARGLWGGEEIEGDFCIVTEAGEWKLPYRVHLREHEEQEDSYAWFVSADPIPPLPEAPKAEEPVVQEVVGGEELTPQEAVRLAELVRKGNVDTTVGLARLIRAYERYGGKELLESICALYIRSGRTNAESFLWYERGVRLELKITNLYEYFMMAAPPEYEEPLPRNLLLYFQMENTLSSRQKAMLYANIIRYQKPDSEIYLAYRPQMEAFMLDQLLERRLSEDMAVIYERFLVEGLLTIDFAEALADIMFLRRLRCEDPRIRQVQVQYDALQRRISVPLSGGQALIPVYTPGAVIVLVDDQGNCYTSSVPYTLTRLLDERRYAGRCRELLRFHQGLYLYLCGDGSRSHVLTADNVENYKRILKISGLTDVYKEQVRQEILQFYYEHHDLDNLDREFFVSETGQMNPKDRSRYIEILILRGMYEEAWEMLQRCGGTLVRISLLIKLAAWRIREVEYEEEEFLLKLCLYIFQQHKYNESILEYLAGYYYGSAETMEAIWQEAHAFELNVFDLEERLLGQMLFTGQLRESAFAIFRDYRALGGEGLVCRAYLTWLARESFVLGHAVPEETFNYLEQGLAWEENLADVCSLAYLKELSVRPKLNEHQEIRADRLVKDLIRRKMRFAFMKPLLERLGRSWVLEDRMFVEYRANPSHKVVLHYVIETPREKSCNYVAERLYPVEPGLFVREFTLFYGERLTWFLTETDEEGAEISTADQSYTEQRTESLVSGTKYAYIYEMARAVEDHDRGRLSGLLDACADRQFLVETLFSLSVPGQDM